ncbi:MAG: copper amine oxidase [Peptococcaceae bacterium]|nr:MAG: copper amine oxidase [Peptococcaceae bacterium]
MSPVDLKPAMDRAASYLLAKEKLQENPLSPWSYVALAAAGQNLEETRAGQSCEQQLGTARATADYCLLVLTLLSAGENPSGYHGQNLVRKIQAAQLGNGKFADNIDGSGEGENGEQALVNAHIWAVLALHAAGAETPDRVKAAQWLIGQQHADGGFNWYIADKTPDVDSTGMALMALGALGERADSPAVQKAVACLKSVQEDNGGFTSWGYANPESCNMVIEGLTAVGIDPAGADMSKPGGNPATAMLVFQLPDGSFEHTAGTGSNEMATQQALTALSDIYYGKTLYARLAEKSRGAAGKTAPAGRKVQFKVGANEYEVAADGQRKVERADAAPFIENNRTYVPVRYLALALGIPETGIRWSPSARTVTLVDNGTTVTLAIGGNIMYKNGVAGPPLDVVPVIRNDRTFLPARCVAESFGYQVRWEGMSVAVWR